MKRVRWTKGAIDERAEVCGYDLRVVECRPTSRTDEERSFATTRFPWRAEVEIGLVWRCRSQHETQRAARKAAVKLARELAARRRVVGR